MITAAFKESGSNLADNQTTPSETSAYNVSAVIKDSAGTEVGKLNLQPSSGGRYAGIWNGSMLAGVYRVTLVASESAASRTFDDALQIDIR